MVSNLWYKLEKWYYWNKSTIWFAIFAFLGLAFFMWFVYHLMIYSNTSNCNEYAEVTGHETKMVNMNCYVKYDDEWYLIQQIKKVN